MINLVSHKKSPKTKESRSWVVCKWIVFSLFLLYAVSLLYPLAFALVTSLRSQEAYDLAHVSLKGITGFSAYISAFRTLEMGASSASIFVLIVNSLWYTVGGCGLSIVASSMTAYIVAKYSFKGRGIIYAVAIFTLSLPIVGQIPSQFVVYNALGIYDSPLLILSFFTGFGFNFVVLYSGFKNISWDYAEAAFIDGAGHTRVFLQIMLPHALSLIGALFIITCVNYWNDYMGPLLFLPSWPTLASGLYMYRTLAVRGGGVSMPVLYAGLLVSVLPILILYGLFSRQMMEMTFSGGLKG